MCIVYYSLKEKIPRHSLELLKNYVKIFIVFLTLFRTNILSQRLNVKKLFDLFDVVFSMCI